MLKLHGMHEGDRSEYYAAAALSAVGHVVPVVRQADFFLTDFIIQLFIPDKKVMSTTGLEFGLQNKSNEDEIPITGEQARLCFFQTMRPFFIGVFNRAARRMSIYTTIHRLLLAWTGLEQDVVLKFGGDRFHVPDPGGDASMYLGDPIAVIELDKLDQDNSEAAHQVRRKVAAVIGRWVQVETMAIVWRRDHLPWVPLPLQYNTNEVFDFGNLEYAPVLDRAAFSGAMKSLGKSLIALTSYLNTVVKDGPPLSDGERADRDEVSAFIAEVKTQIDSL